MLRGWIGSRSGGRGSSAKRRAAINAPPPAMRTSIPARSIQPMGDRLNSCRLLKMPLRVRNVAKLHSAKVRIAEPEGRLLEQPAQRQVIRQWIKAVPVSQGIREPFSTGSQFQ